MAIGGKPDVLIKIDGDQKGLDKSVKKSNDSLSSIGGSAASAGIALAAMAAVGVAAIAGLTYAAWGLTKGYKDFGVELDKIQKSTGVNAETASQMAYAAEQEHASIEDLQTGWRKLAKTMSDADDGLAESKRSFESVGVAIRDDSGKLKELDVMTLEVADAFAAMTDDTKKAALAQELFGRSGMSMIPFFELGSKGIQELMEESKALGNVWTNEMAQGAKLFDDKLTAMSYRFKTLKWQIGSELMPEFEKITDWFLSNKDWLIQSAKDIFDIKAEGFGEKVVTELDKIKSWVDENKDTLSGTWSALITSTDMAITTVKVLFTSLAELAAFQQYIKSGGGDEEYKRLQKVSASTAEVYQDIGQKDWAQGIVGAFGPTGAAASQTISGVAKQRAGASVIQAQTGMYATPDSIINATLAAIKLITIKLDSNATKELLDGRTAHVAEVNV